MENNQSMPKFITLCEKQCRIYHEQGYKLFLFDSSPALSAFKKSDPKTLVVGVGDGFTDAEAIQYTLNMLNNNEFRSAKEAFTEDVNHTTKTEKRGKSKWI